MRERLPLISNQDTGRDQAAADAHLRRHAILESDIENFYAEIDRLSKNTGEMIGNGHFDAANVSINQICSFI